MGDVGIGLIPGVAGPALPDVIDQAVEIPLECDVSEREFGRRPAEALLVRLLQFFLNLDQVQEGADVRSVGVSAATIFSGAY